MQIIHATDKTAHETGFSEHLVYPTSSNRFYRNLLAT